MDVELDELSFTRLLLAQEQLNSAQLAVSVRQLALENLTTAIQIEYSEGGKYEVTGIDLKTKKVLRKLVRDTERESSRSLKEEPSAK